MIEERYEKYVAGFLLGILILLILNYGFVINFLMPPSYIYANLCDYDGSLDLKFIDAERGHVNVPDYAADIYVEPLSEKVMSNSDVEFTYKIVDKGIQKLNTSYFYIFLFDPDDKLRAIFPCFCGEENSDFSRPSDYSCHEDYCYFSSDGSKFKKWDEDAGSLDCNENYFCIDSCLPRSAFMEGVYDNKNIVYRYEADKAGTWEIHTFLFEEKYEKRDFSGFLEPDFFYNAVAYEFAQFEVIKESEKGVDPMWYLQKIIEIILVLGTTVGICHLVYDSSKKFITTHKNQILVSLVLFIVLILVSLFFCKISCP